jgi:hypothetical protein
MQIMLYFARKTVFVASTLRVGAAFAALLTLAYGIYLVINGALATGGVWIAGSVFFGFSAYMVLGLVALLMGGVGLPAVRR